MTWKQLESEVKKLAKRIADKPDVIIGIVRAGMIPARFLSTYLAVKDVHCLAVKKLGKKRKVVTEVDVDLSGKRILLVEDILETGGSLLAAKEYLTAKGAQVKTACLYVLPQCKIAPDYFLKKVKSVRKFPWE